MEWSLTVSMGMALGALASLTSVGAGALGVMAPILLYPALPMARIVAPISSMRCR